MTNINDSQIIILSPIISIIMIFGLNYFGLKIIEFTKTENIILKISDIKYQSTMVGAIILTSIIHPLIIFNLLHINIIKLISISLLLLGIIFIFKNIKFIRKYKIKSINIPKIIFLILFMGFILLALGPITDADSLDYHIGVPLYIINNGEYPNQIFWFHLLKSGSGEILNTLGLILKAEQFPALVQFSALLSIIGILLKKKNFLNADNKTYLLILFLISSPILIFLVPSAKIQLLYIGSSAFIFTSAYVIEKNDLNNNYFLALIMIFLMMAVTAKFSFALGSFLLWTLFLYLSFKKNFLKKYIFLTIIIFSITILPKSIWKMNVYEMNIFASLFSPLPLHLYGYEALQNSLTSCGYHGCFPYWVLFPKDLSSFTEALGLGSLIIFTIIFKRKTKLVYFLGLVIFHIILSKIFGPNNARWFLEPYVWLILLVSFEGQKNNLFSSALNKLIVIQSVGIIFVVYFGVFTLSVGSLSKSLKEKVLTEKASGYSLFKWSNNTLPKNSVLISTHRSFSLSNLKTIPGDFLLYIDVKNKEAFEYLLELKKMKPTHILFYKNKNKFNDLKDCLGNLKYYKNKVGKTAKRNPFGMQHEKYDGFIYEFSHEKLPFCVNK